MITRAISIILLLSFSTQALAVESTAPLFSCENFVPDKNAVIDPKAKAVLDRQIKDRALRLKLEGIFDIAVSGTQKWINIPGFTCDRGLSEHYWASRDAAKLILSNTSSSVLEMQRQKLIASRLQTYLKIHDDIDQLGSLRKQLSYLEKKTFVTIGAGRARGDAEAQNLKDEISRLEKKLIDKDVIFNNPELFEPKDAMSSDIDIVGLGRSVGPYSPNDLYKNIERWFYRNYSTSVPTDAYAGPMTDTLPIPTAILNIPKDEKYVAELTKKHFKDLDEMFSRKFNKMFISAHEELFGMCKDDSKEYYFNDGLVSLAADELLQSKKLSAPEINKAYSEICTERIQIAADNKVRQKRAEYLSVANTVLTVVSIFFIGTAVVTKIGGALVKRGLVRWSARVAEIGSRVRIHGAHLNSAVGAVFAGTLVAEGKVGFTLNDYDREIKNLFLMIQVAKRADATEVEKLKAEIAATVLKAGAQQTKASDYFYKGLNGALAASVSLLTIPVILRELQDVESLVKVRVLYGQLSQGTLSEPLFLQSLYQIRMGKFAKEVDQDDFRKWLISMKVEDVGPVVTVPKKASIAERVGQILESSAVDKGLREGIVANLYKFQSAEALEAAETLIVNMKENSKGLTQINRALANVSESAAKQRYLATTKTAGKLSQADQKILLAWQDETAIEIITNIRTKAQRLAQLDKFPFNADQRAWEKALKEDLGSDGYHKLCVLEGCSLCSVK